ncbi:MAG TPA: L-threonylcarbamoyladenylate synthase [Syntrophales bacterium]|jgi:L-threonylcarbamoyladenylate synthase|nr:L-threonylcarbamoyladenylate synthase [Syntrophales bacterium]
MMMEIWTVDPEAPEPETLARALALLRRGGTVAYPTETFYGLGADALNEAAVRKIYAIKGRGFRNPLPVIIGARDDLTSLVADVPDVALPLMRDFWPGPLTLVFRAAPCVPPLLTGGTGKIGIRLSSHPVARELARRLGGPLTATSANLSGRQEAVSARDVRVNLQRPAPNVILDGGPTPGGRGSTVLDVTTDPPTVLREGAVPPDRILRKAPPR